MSYIMRCVRLASRGSKTKLSDISKTMGSYASYTLSMSHLRRGCSTVPIRVVSKLLIFLGSV